jgi:hypothetical protein
MRVYGKFFSVLNVENAQFHVEFREVNVENVLGVCWKCELQA